MQLVEWVDAHDDAAVWTAQADLDGKERLIHTVGWRLPEVKPGHATLALSLDARTDHVGYAIHIPLVSVRRVTDLTARRKRAVQPANER